jgi:hypothetical protein
LQISHLQTQQIRYLAWGDAGRVQKSIREHRGILSALAQKDALRLERVVDEHLEGGKADYRRIFPVGGDKMRMPPAGGARHVRRPPADNRATRAAARRPRDMRQMPV